MKKRKIIQPLLAVVLTAAFPAVFLYCNNSEEAAFSEIVPVLGIFILISLGFFGICCLLTQNWHKAAMITALYLVALLNYAQMENAVQLFLPNAKYWHIMPTIIFTLLLVGYLISVYLPDDLAQIISDVVCLVFGALIVINATISIPGTINRIRSEKQLDSIQASTVTENEGKETQPNIYWLIFDEYAGFKQIEEYYDYDNAVLKNYLNQNNFDISFTSRNESIQTVTILTNAVNLDYVVTNNTSVSEREVRRKQGVLFSIIDEKGYSLRGLDAGNFFGLPSPLENASQPERAVTAGGQDIGDICIEQTVFYPFYNPNASNVINSIMEIVEYMSTKENLEDSNTFTVVYLSFPHEPFLVDENGQATRSEDWNNWDDDRYYLGQYKYATKLMMQMMDNILANDPDSIIILQSDHGARASTDDSFMVKFPLEVMANPLNAVYYRGEEIDIEGLSSVNTMRFILNKLFSENYEMIPVPEDVFKYK